MMFVACFNGYILKGRIASFVSNQPVLNIYNIFAIYIHDLVSSLLVAHNLSRIVKLYVWHLYKIYIRKIT